MKMQGAVAQRRALRSVLLCVALPCFHVKKVPTAYRVLFGGKVLTKDQSFSNPARVLTWPGPRFNSLPRFMAHDTSREGLILRRLIPARG